MCRMVLIDSIAVADASTQFMMKGTNIMKELLSSEIVNSKVNCVNMTSAIISTSDKVLESIKNDIKKYNVSHGSHSQHSSQSTYGD